MSGRWLDISSRQVEAVAAPLQGRRAGGGLDIRGSRHHRTKGLRVQQSRAYRGRRRPVGQDRGGAQLHSFATEDSSLNSPGTPRNSLPT